MTKRVKSFCNLYYCYKLLSYCLSVLWFRCVMTSSWPSVFGLLSIQLNVDLFNELFPGLREQPFVILITSRILPRLYKEFKYCGDVERKNFCRLCLTCKLHVESMFESSNTGELPSSRKALCNFAAMCMH